VGQRCPVCGQGTFYELPSGVEMRIDGHAWLSAMRSALQKRRCSACGEMFTASLPREAGEEKDSARATGGARGVPVLSGVAMVSPAGLPSHGGSAGARCDAVGPDREGRRLE